MEHSKSPWVVSRDHRSTGYIVKTLASPSKASSVVCEVKALPGFLDGNTALISVAPDMFRILKKLCDAKRITQADWDEAGSILLRAQGK